MPIIYRESSHLGFSTIEGWVNLQLFHVFYWLVGGSFTALIGGKMIAAEIDSKQIDLILTRAIKRSEIIISRYVVMLFYALCLVVSVFIGIVLETEEINYPILFASFTILPFITLVGTITILVSTFIKGQIKCLITVAIFVGISFSFTEMIIKLVPELKPFENLSIFNYYRSNDILLRNEFNVNNIVILAVLNLICLAIAIIIFESKDIMVD